MLRHPEGEVGRHERQRDLDARIARRVADAQHQPADARCRRRSRRRRSRRRCRAPDRARRRRCSRPRPRSGRGSAPSRRWRAPRPSRITEQPARQTEPARDRERRHDVRRRDDRAQHEADRPTAGRAARARPRRPSTVVKTTQPIASSVIGRRLKRNSRQLIATPAGVDQRRQHQQQHQLGHQLDARQPRHERQRDADDAPAGWPAARRCAAPRAATAATTISSSTAIWMVSIIAPSP